MLSFMRVKFIALQLCEVIDTLQMYSVVLHVSAKRMENRWIEPKIVPYESMTN